MLRSCTPSGGVHPCRKENCLPGVNLPSRTTLFLKPFHQEGRGPSIPCTSSKNNLQRYGQPKRGPHTVLVHSYTPYGRGNPGFRSASSPLSPSDPRRRDLPDQLASARTWRDLNDLIARYEDVLLPAEVMQMISAAPRMAPPPALPPPTSRPATPYKLALGSRNPGMSQAVAAQQAWEQQLAQRANAMAAARAARMEQEQQERKLYQDMMRRLAARARRQLPDISNSRVLGDTIHALAHAGALEPGFASELLERASQEAATGSLTLSDLSDLMSALGSSGYRPAPSALTPMLRALDPWSKAGSSADLPALLGGLARLGYAPEDSFLERTIEQLQQQQVRQLQQQRQEQQRQDQLQQEQQRQEQQRQQALLEQQKQQLQEEALRQQQQQQQQQRRQRRQQLQPQEQQQQQGRVTMSPEWAEQVQQVAAAIRALHLMGRPQAAEKLRRNFLAQLQEMQAEDAARQESEAAAAAQQQSQQQQARARQQQQQQQQQQAQQLQQEARAARAQQEQREREALERQRRQQEMEQRQAREREAVRTVLASAPTWRHLHALLASHPEHLGVPELCRMLHRVPALLKGSLLTWRERAELADFLEGAGALLVQQLDVLQAKRRSSAGAEGQPAEREHVVCPDDGVRALEALLSLRYLSSPLMAVLLREVRTSFPLFEAHHFEACLKALAAAGVRPSLSWMTALVESSLPALPTCSLDQLHSLATSLATLEVNPGSDWLVAYLESMHAQQNKGSIGACLDAADALDRPLVTEWLTKLFEQGRSMEGAQKPQPLPAGAQPPASEALQSQPQEEDQQRGMDPAAMPALESIEFDEEAALAEAEQAEAARAAGSGIPLGHPMSRVPEGFLRDQMSSNPPLEQQQQEQQSWQGTQAPSPASAAAPQELEGPAQAPLPASGAPERAEPEVQGAEAKQAGVPKKKGTAARTDQDGRRGRKSGKAAAAAVDDDEVEAKRDKGAAAAAAAKEAETKQLEAAKREEDAKRAEADALKRREEERKEEEARKAKAAAAAAKEEEEARKAAAARREEETRKVKAEAVKREEEARRVAAAEAAQKEEEAKRAAAAAEAAQREEEAKKKAKAKKQQEEARKVKAEAAAAEEAEAVRREQEKQAQAKAEAEAKRAEVQARKAQPPPKNNTERAARFFNRLASKATMPGPTRAVYNELKAKMQELEAVRQECAEAEEAAKQRAENAALQLSSLRSQMEVQEADFQRFKQRHWNEVDAAGTEVRLKMYGKLLPLLDNFERAAETLKVVTRTEGEQAVHDVYQKGVAEPIRETLRSAGIEEIGESGVQFDPLVHEAIMMDEDPNVPENTVTCVLQKGYKFGEKLLRPALVKVSSP